MVIRHDGIHAESGGIRDLPDGSHAGVHRHDQRHALCRQRVHTGPGHSVSLAQTVGDVPDDRNAQSAQVEVQAGDGGHTVHVIVAVHRNRLPVPDGCQHARNGGLHIGQQEGIMRLHTAVAEEGGSSGGIIVAAVAEQTGGQRTDAQRQLQTAGGGLPFGVSLLPTERPYPCPAGQSGVCGTCFGHGCFLSLIHRIGLGRTASRSSRVGLGAPLKGCDRILRGAPGGNPLSAPGRTAHRWLPPRGCRPRRHW